MVIAAVSVKKAFQVFFCSGKLYNKNVVFSTFVPDITFRIRYKTALYKKAAEGHPLQQLIIQYYFSST